MLKIIFCAFNEAKNLPKFLAELQQELQSDFEIITCLDGTSDESEKILNDFSKTLPQNNYLKVLPLENQRGLGRAYKRIFLEVIHNSHPDDLVISLDADNTHPASQIKSMITHFKSNSLDLLIASRFCNKSVIKNFPLHRIFISQSVSWLLQALFGVKKIDGKNLKDYTSGFRIYRALALKNLFKSRSENFINEKEFTYTCEVVVKLARLNCRIDEIALLYDYGHKTGDSKLRIWKNFYRLMVLIWNLWLRK